MSVFFCLQSEVFMHQSVYDRQSCLLTQSIFNNQVFFQHKHKLIAWTIHRLNDECGNIKHNIISMNLYAKIFQCVL